MPMPVSVTVIMRTRAALSPIRTSSVTGLWLHTRTPVPSPTVAATTSSRVPVSPSTLRQRMISRWAECSCTEATTAVPILLTIMAHTSVQTSSHLCRHIYSPARRRERARCRCSTMSSATVTTSLIPITSTSR